MTLIIYTIHTRKKPEDKEYMNIFTFIHKTLGKNHLVSGCRTMPKKEEEKFWKFYNKKIIWGKKK